MFLPKPAVTTPLSPTFESAFVSQWSGCEARSLRTLSPKPSGTGPALPTSDRITTSARLGCSNNAACSAASPWVVGTKQAEPGGQSRPRPSESACIGGPSSTGAVFGSRESAVDPAKSLVPHAAKPNRHSAVLVQRERDTGGVRIMSVKVAIHAAAVLSWRAARRCSRRRSRAALSLAFRAAQIAFSRPANLSAGVT